MRKFIRLHQKKFLAVCMVILMISFAANSGNRATNNHSDMIIGTIGNNKIRSLELQQAHAEWVALTRNLVVPGTNPYNGQPMERSLAETFFPPEVLQNDKASDLFMLLRHEAKEAGVLANSDDLHQILTNDYRRPDSVDDSYDDTVREAATDFLLIKANFNRLASNVKVSQPQRDNFQAQADQPIQLNVVELTQSDFVAKAPAPTTQQAEEQFTKYSNVTPGHPDEQNRFGFGYRLPEGVKLQYLVIYDDEARKAVAVTQTPYDWDVKARLYYLQHKDEFATTQPTKLAIGPTSQPSIRPYSQVADQALKSLRDPLIAKLKFDVQGKILTTMQADWRTFSQSGKSTGPAGYPSYTYLINLSNQIQAQLGMRVNATEQARDFLSEKELADLPGIGPATSDRFPFAMYASQLGAKYLARADKNTPAARAELMQPAAPVKDINQNIYIFRIVDARPAQPAPSLADVASQVYADLRNQEAYRLTKASAAPLLTAARNGTLPAAASALGKSLWTTPAFTKQTSPYLGMNITLSEVGEKEFIDQAFDLLTQFSPSSNPHPARLIEIPEDGKIYVAQLVNVSANWDPSNYFQYSLKAARELRVQQLLELHRGWMQYDAIVQRLGYKPEASSKDSSS
jgi:hypothetical protein